MQGSQLRGHLARCLAITGLAALAHISAPPALAATPPAMAERIDVALDILSPAGELSTQTTRIERPGARYIKVHFDSFVLPDGVGVEVASPDGAQRYFYWRDRRDAHTWDARQGDDGVTRFSAMSIDGDTAIVRVLGRLDRLRPGLHRIHIDHYLSGRTLEEPAVPVSTLERALGGGGSKPQTTCGINERYDAVCFKDSHRPEFETSHAVAVLVTATGEECTAWRVGPDNRLFTAQHCIGSQADVTGSEIWFNYKARTCGGSSTETTVKVTGDQFLAADAVLDFGLFTVNDFPAVSGFGYLGLDVREASLGEGIFIPQHGLGRPAQLALESDMNGSGYCEVDHVNLAGYASGTDIGYYCDTTTSSSGAPVITADSGKVIALHHLGGCMNSGSKMKKIWPKVAAHFGGTIPDGDVAWTGGDWADGGGEVNEPPEAWFTFSCDGLECDFDGTPSTDSDGSIVDWSWSLGGGATGSGSSLSHTYSTGGTRSVRLTVTDDQGAEHAVTRTVTVEAPNQPPTANFSVSCIANDCTFDAGASSDSDGQIVGYSWTLGDGATASGGAVSHTYAEAGAYTVRVTVEDDDGATAKKTRTVNVTLPNEAPEAAFTFSCQGLSCQFDGGGSMDSDGSVTQWTWSFGDGSSGQGAAANHTFGADGEYDVRLTVTDDDGATDVITHIVHVAAAVSNAAPRADFTWECTEGTCRFDASASSDSDGEIVHYEWGFGDGSGSTGVAPTHVYAASGAYRVRLTVRDDDGVQHALIQTVSVEIPAAVNERPVAAFEVACTQAVCSFDAAGSRDADGTVVEYEWDFGDGQTGRGETIEHEYEADGGYTVTLTVVDDQGWSGSTQRKVEIARKRTIKLQVGGSSFNGKVMAVLKWSGAETSNVDIYRDGKLVARTPNSGIHIDKSLLKSVKKMAYRLCEQGSTHCSGDVALK